MTLFANTGERYGAVAILLHWLMAILLVTLLGLGFYMVTLPDVGFATTKITLILYHKELGILALALVAVRLSWRIGNVLPALVVKIPDWQKVAARFVHLCFYGLMFSLPITGWFMSSAAGITVSFFGYFNLPDFILPNDDLFRSFIEIHKWLGYALVGALLVHVGAALRHHFVIKDETLMKMLPHKPF